MAKTIIIFLLNLRTHMDCVSHYNSRHWKNLLLKPGADHCIAHLLARILPPKGRTFPLEEDCDVAPAPRDLRPLNGLQRVPNVDDIGLVGCDDLLADLQIALQRMLRSAGFLSSNMILLSERSAISAWLNLGRRVLTRCLDPQILKDPLCNARKASLMR